MSQVFDHIGGKEGGGIIYYCSQPTGLYECAQAVGILVKDNLTHVAIFY